MGRPVTYILPLHPFQPPCRRSAFRPWLPRNSARPRPHGWALRQQPAAAAEADPFPPWQCVHHSKVLARHPPRPTRVVVVGAEAGPCHPWQRRRRGGIPPLPARASARVGFLLSAGRAPSMTDSGVRTPLRTSLPIPPHPGDKGEWAYRQDTNEQGRVGGNQFTGVGHWLLLYIRSDHVACGCATLSASGTTMLWMWSGRMTTATAATPPWI